MPGPRDDLPTADEAFGPDDSAVTARLPTADEAFGPDDDTPIAGFASDAGNALSEGVRDEGAKLAAGALAYGILPATSRTVVANFFADQKKAKSPSRQEYEDASSAATQKFGQDWGDSWVPDHPGALIPDAANVLGNYVSHPRETALGATRGIAGLVPFMAGTKLGAAAGTMAAGPVMAISGPVAPFTGAATVLGGAIAGGAVAQLPFSYGDWVLNKLGDEAQKRGLDPSNPDDIAKLESDSKFMDRVRQESMTYGLTSSALQSAVGAFGGKLWGASAGKGIAARTAAGVADVASQAAGFGASDEAARSATTGDKMRPSKVAAGAAGSLGMAGAFTLLHPGEGGKTKDTLPPAADSTGAEAGESVPPGGGTEAPPADGPFTPRFDMENQGYGVAGPDGGFVSDHRFPTADHAKAAAGMLNSAIPKPPSSSAPKGPTEGAAVVAPVANPTTGKFSLNDENGLGKTVETGFDSAQSAEKEADAINSGSPVPATTEESSGDIAAQIKAMLDPNHPKDAVFVAKGSDSAIPDSLPDNVMVQPRPEGTLLTTNRKKLEAFQAPDLTDQALAKILDYPQTKDDAIASGNPLAVQAFDADGNMVQGPLSSPDALPQTIASTVAQTPPGGNVIVSSPQDALAARANRVSEEQKAQPPESPLPPKADAAPLPAPDLVHPEPVAESGPVVSKDGSGWKVEHGNMTFRGANGRPFKNEAEAQAFAQERGEAGKSHAPVEVKTAEDMEVGRDHVKAPSPEQAAAGNYQHLHREWNGLPISIETVKGGTRTDKNGQWSVPDFPADYGRFKGTIGGDGEHVDLFMGDHPESPHVFVLDQIDPKTGKWDEHKVLTGYESLDQAVAAYDSSFSDGSGPSRRGKVTEMTVPELKEWLKTEGTKSEAHPQFVLRKNLEAAIAKMEPGTKLTVGMAVRAMNEGGYKAAPKDIKAEFARMVADGRLEKKGDSFVVPDNTTPREGVVGDMLKSGEVVLTATGRKTSPFPEIKWGSDRAAGKTLKAVDRWMMDNAIAEAMARSDEFNLRQFEANRDRPSQADRDSAEYYLFDKSFVRTVAKPFLKPLTGESAPKEEKPSAPQTKTFDAGWGAVKQRVGILTRARDQLLKKFGAGRLAVIDGNTRKPVLRIKDGTPDELKAVQEEVDRQTQKTIDKSQAAAAKGKPPREFPETLNEWIAKKGGITDNDGDLAGQGLGTWHIGRFSKKLIHAATPEQKALFADKGMERKVDGHDDLVTHAIEEHFLPEGSDTNDLYREMVKDAGATSWKDRVYRSTDSNRVHDALNKAANDEHGDWDVGYAHYLQTLRDGIDEYDVARGLRLTDREKAAAFEHVRYGMPTHDAVTMAMDEEMLYSEHHNAAQGQHREDGYDDSAIPFDAPIVTGTTGSDGRATGEPGEGASEPVSGPARGMPASGEERAPDERSSGEGEPHEDAGQVTPPPGQMRSEKVTVYEKDKSGKDVAVKRDQGVLFSGAETRSKANIKGGDAPLDFGLFGNGKEEAPAHKEEQGDIFSQAEKPKTEGASWVIKNKQTGEVIMETFDKKKVEALNTDKYVAVPIKEHLASPNAVDGDPLKGMFGGKSLPSKTRFDIARGKADPVNDIHGDPTGWLKVEPTDLQGTKTGDVAVIHPTEDEVHWFTPESRNKHSDVLRAAMQAQVFAIDHPIEREPVGTGPKPELVIKPMFDKAEPPAAFDPASFTKIAADSIEKLRADDVYRLFEEAPKDIDAWDDLRSYIIENRPDLARNVMDAIEEIGQPERPPMNDISPEQRTAYIDDMKSKGEQIKAALAGGEKVILRTMTKATSYSDPENVRIGSDGVYFQSGKKWVMATDAQLEDMVGTLKQTDIYRYGATMRPPGHATIPKDGLISGSHQTSDNVNFRHGTVDYTRELTPAEERDYELHRIGKIGPDGTPEEVLPQIPRNIVKSARDAIDQLSYIKENIEDISGHQDDIAELKAKVNAVGEWANDHGLDGDRAVKELGDIPDIGKGDLTEKSVDDLNKDLADLDKKIDADSKKGDFDFDDVGRKIDIKKALANKMAEEPGGIVLAMKRSDGKPMGVSVTEEPDGSGRWRLTYFDERGFSGDTIVGTKAEAIKTALGDGYRDTDRNALRKLSKTKEFQDGNEATEKVREENDRLAQAVEDRRSKEDLNDPPAVWWNGLTPEDRLDIAQKAGWETQDGRPDRTARKLSGSNWSDVSEAAQNILRKKAPAETSSILGVSDKHPEWATQHEPDIGGKTVYSDPEVALIQGSSVLNGKPVYAAAMKGKGRTRVDIDSYTGNGITPEQRARLVEAKQRLLAADQAKFDERPNGPFKDGETFAHSDNVPAPLAETAKAWLDMLGIKDRVYLTTTEDARSLEQAEAHGLNGPFSAIRSAGLDAGENGSTRKMSNGDHYIALKLGARTSANLEALAHEIGHILEKSEFAKADPETRTKIVNAYQEWAKKNITGSARELIDALRAHTTGKLTTVSDMEAGKLPPYWSSFKEFFADQVSRWAMTSEKPTSVVGQFFKRIADGLKRLYEAASGKKYLPTPEMKGYLDGLAKGYSPLQGIDAKPYTLSEHGSIAKRIKSGDITADELKANFERLMQAVPAIKDELGKKTIKELAGGPVSGMKKAVVIDHVLNYMKRRYIPGDSFTWSPMTETVDAAYRRLVSSVTDADIARAAGKSVGKAIDTAMATVHPETAATLRMLGHSDEEISMMPPVMRQRLVDELQTKADAVEFVKEPPKVTPTGRTFYIATGETGAVHTLRSASIGVYGRMVDTYLTNLAVDRDVAIEKAKRYVAINGEDKVFFGAPDELRAIERTGESKGGQKTGPLFDQSGAEPLPDPVGPPQPDVQPRAPHEMADHEIIASKGLSLEEKTAKSGKTYWAVSGDTLGQKEVLDSLGFGEAFKMGGKWFRSVRKGDPTEKLAAALRGEKLAPPVEERGGKTDWPTIDRGKAEVYLKAAKMEVSPGRDGGFVISGKGTYDAKEIIKDMGGKWDGYAKAWTFRDDPTERIGAALAEQKEHAGSGVDGDAGTGIGADDEQRLRELRQREDARPDERSDADPSKLVGDDTKSLISAGLKFGIPEEVVKDQIEDTGMIVRAYEAGKPAFILANAPGTGKTYVLGAAIRELRGRGADKFVYVTMNQDLIAQIQRDLAPYGVDDVKFHTYSDLSGKGAVDTNGAVLIFDEAHNVKNVEAGTKRAEVAQDKIASAKFTIFSSATPYENPVQARYVAATGLFDPAGGFDEWAKAYGAAVKRRKFYNPKTQQEQVEEKVYWVGGKAKQKDGAAARDWIAKQGIMTQRQMKIDPKMVDTEFNKSDVDQKWVDMFHNVNDAYEAALNTYRDEDGHPLDVKITSEISRHREGMLKRILEGSKVPFAIERAEQHLADGKSVVMFVETKADRDVGKFRKSEFFKDPTLYSYPEMQSLMSDWKVAEGMARMSREAPPPKPFADFIYTLASALHDAGIDYQLPSTADLITDHFGKDKVATYTGAVTMGQASKNKADFLSGRKPILVATMAKGGTGLSLHDTVGDRPTVQVNLNLPWTASSVDQVSGRVARYGLQSKAAIEWLFAGNIPWEANKLAPRVGARMRDMGALVRGVEMKSAEALDGNFDFDGTINVGQGANEGKIDLAAGEDEGRHDLYAQAERLEASRRKAQDTSGGFFATPYPLAVLMQKISGVKPGDRVLEPSAGHGNLVRFMPDDAHVTAVEQRPDNFKTLQATLGKRAIQPDLHNADFLDWATPDQNGRYDIVTMNPPFERAAGIGSQDVAHVQRAYDLLAPGGRLVSIMGEGPFFRDNKGDAAFRQWLDDVGATVVKLPADTFKKSGTGANARMVVIDRDRPGARSDIDLGDVSADSLRDIEGMIPGRVEDMPDLSRRYSAGDYQRILDAQRESEGIRAAIKDPKTGKVYSGWSHQAAIESVPHGDESGAWGRLSDEWDRSTQNVGFLDKAGNFLTRDETNAKWGTLTMEDIRDLRRDSKLRFSRSDDKAAAPFYSALTKAVEEHPQQKGPANQWKGIIEKLSQKGVKSEEIAWSGVTDWLESRGNEMTTKAEVLGHLKANEVQINEVTKEAVGPVFRKSYSTERELLEAIHGDEMLVNEDGSLKRGAEIRETKDGWNLYDSSEPETKYGPGGDYVTPGGENYREMLLTMPKPDDIRQAKLDKINGQFNEIVDQHGPIPDMPASARAEIDRLTREHDEIADSAKEDYHSGHWDEPNVLAHVRFDERTGENGERILHIHEIQSDMHQRGRKFGYKDADGEYRIDGMDASEWESRATEIKSVDGESKAWKKALENARNLSAAGGVPDAPMKTAWHEMAFRRMARYAAENGFDRVTWDTGETNAERYDLSKQIKDVTLEGAGDNLRLTATDMNDYPVISKRPTTRSGLVDLIGKEAAEKLLSQPEPDTSNPYAARRLLNADLKVGGEGMAGFYDKMMPDYARKFGKKFGAKVEDTTVKGDKDTHGYEGPIPSEKDMERVRSWLEDKNADHGISPITHEKAWMFDADHRTLESLLDVMAHMENEGKSFPEAMKRYGSLELARIFGGDNVDKFEQVPVHSMTITPAMRETAMSEGFPMFSRAKGDGASPSEPWEHVATGMEGVRGEFYTAHEAEMAKAVNEISDRIIPKADVQEYSKLRATKESGHESGTEGASWRRRFDDGTIAQMVAWASDAKSPLRAIRHEVVHALRQSGLYTPAEWGALEGAAKSGDWIGKHGVRDREPNLTHDEMLEESIADEFSHWNENRKAGIEEKYRNYPALVLSAFKRMDLMFRRVKAAAKRVFGQDLTADDIFASTETGDVGGRDVKADAQPDQTKFSRSDAAPSYKDRLDDMRTFAKGKDVHEAARDWVRQEGDDTGHEHIVAVDRDTGEVLFAGTSGHETRVHTPAEINRDSAAKDDSLILHHSHPGEGGPSIDDLTSLLSPGVHSVVAHDTAGDSYAVRLSDATRKGIDRVGADVSETHLENTYVAAARVVMKLVNAWVKNGLINEKQSGPLTLDLVNRALSHAGVTEYQTSRPIEKSVAAQSVNAVRKASEMASLLAKNFWENEHGIDAVTRADALRTDGRVDGVFGKRGDRTGSGRPQSEGRDSSGHEGDRGPEGQEAGRSQVVEGGVDDDGRLTRTPRKPRGLGYESIVPSEEPSYLDRMAKRFPAVAKVREMAAAGREFATSIKAELQMFATPMDVGSDRAKATAKDFANACRKSRWVNQMFYNFLNHRFTKDDHARMWNAMDETSVRAQDEVDARVARFMEEDPEMNEAQAKAQARAELPDIIAEMKADKTGIYALPEEQRLVVEEMSRHAEALWNRALAAGMVKGEGLPFWTPRAAAVIGADGTWGKIGKSGDKAAGLDAMGRNLTTFSPNTLHRKNRTVEEFERAVKSVDEGAEVIRDIRAMPLAMSRLERAIAGRELVNKIDQIGKLAGAETTSTGEKPGFVTIDHPALTTFEPKMETVPVSRDELSERDYHVIDGSVWKPVPGKQPRLLKSYKVDKEGNVTRRQVAMDSHGQEIFEKRPIYISREFEGPLKAVLTKEAGPIYQALMHLKGASTGLIMYSPLIHNAVEWGRALPTMPGKVLTFKIYFEGNKAKHDPAMMKQAIDAGMSPIGHRYFNQDISSLMEDPNLTPGRSWTAKLLGGATALVNKDAGEAVKRGIDKAGDFWHNTLLWDRVADLQMGIYKNIRDDAIANGTSQKGAAILAAHMANRYAGALPVESMGEMSRRIANVAMFSRSFTIGNLGVMKDMFTGLPSDVRAQLRRSIGTEETDKVVRTAKRKAIAAFAMDIGLMYAGNAVLQNVLDKWKRDKSWSEIEQGYVDRFHRMMTEAGNNPLAVLNPLFVPDRLTPLADNEPGRENRVLYGADPKTGTNTYLRLPIGKVGEEFINWPTSPLKQAQAKESTIIKPVMDVFTNKDFFGHPIYDQDAKGIEGAASNIGKVVTHLMEAQIPVDSIKAAWDLMTGEGNASLNEMKVLGPLAGVTFSKGYPGGKAEGERATINRRYEASRSAALPNVKKAVEAGKINEAMDIMEKAGIAHKEWKGIIKRYVDPHHGSAVFKNAFERATPEERERLQRAMGD